MRNISSIVHETLLQNHQNTIMIANRIFETRLYNYYLSAADMQNMDIYKASQRDKSQFIIDGQFFLLYLRPIINGTGNYYIESQTRDLCRTDIIVDDDKNIIPLPQPMYDS